MYENFLALIATLLFHAILALALLLNLEQQPVVEAKQYSVVDAVAIDESKLLAKLGSTKAEALQEELQAKWAEQQRLATIRYTKLKQEELRLEKIRLEQEKTKELKRLKKLQQEKQLLEQQRQQEQQRLAKLRQKQQKLKQQAEKAAEKRKHLEQKKKAEAKRKAEAKKKAEQKAEKLRKEKERKAKIAKEQELKRQAEKKAKQQAQQERKRKEAAKKAEIERQKKVARQRQIARETEIKRQIDAKRKAAQDQRVARIIGLIQRRVIQQWQRPAHTSLDLTCRILVKLTPDGAVTHAQVSASSGHAAFDSSAVRAVYKASPLPIPQDLYDRFKTFTFTFRPQ
ncbi:cell envelope integrity protein TolA [Candidatus Albibeggiatoa sp. nov. BB20]|uniref:cell envelope integrity protein TolA n=1 Tax=Candidatus Albibeggiatoa sp. nov. BB20 TaxID=3162723 RepID=UPI0033659255